MGEVSPSRYMVQAGWNDVPHLDETTKRELMSTIEPHLRDARMHGTPSLGAGAIYPVSLEDVCCDPFLIPPYWKRCYGLDVGWNRTAAIWVAQDPSDEKFFVFSEHYMGHSIPLVHASAIKARGAWMMGAIDPAANGRSQGEGRSLIAQYTAAGLYLTPADNAVDAGTNAILQLLSTGRLRIFRHLLNLLAEYRIYRRDENGKIVKRDDHALDAMRYAIMTFNKCAKAVPSGDTNRVIGFATVDSKAGY